jgi:hypothetical protein
LVFYTFKNNKPLLLAGQLSNECEDLYDRALISDKNEILAISTVGGIMSNEVRLGSQSLTV